VYGSTQSTGTSDPATDTEETTMRDTQPATRNERGDETHPAFGLIGVTRRSSTPGAVLFDSDMRHQHSVVVSLSTATRKRDLNHDWIHPEETVVEVQVSEAQWASFVSSMGMGNGVPCTVIHRDGKNVPDLEYDPRLAHSMAEVKEAAARTFGEIDAAMAAYDALDSKATAKEKREAVDRIRDATRHAQANIRYASETLTKHAENVVQRSRADIEAMSMQAAQALGLPTGTHLLSLPETPAVEED